MKFLGICVDYNGNEDDKDDVDKNDADNDDGNKSDEVSPFNFCIRSS